MEAVKQGAATVALKSKTHVVLCALKVILYLSVNLSLNFLSLASTIGTFGSSKENHVY